MALILLQPISRLQEQAEQGSAIVVQQLDEAGLLNQPTQLDKVACPLAPLPCPIARVGTGTGGIEAVTFHCQAPEPCRRGL